MVVNDTGLEIARSLEKGSPIEEVAAGLVARYGIHPERAMIDASSVRERLCDEGFLGEGAATISERSPALQSLFVHLTSRCNLTCPHCYALSPGGRTTRGIDLSADAALRLIDELADLGGRAVTLSGGEALLHPDLRRIIRHATSRGIDTRLLTNGTLLDREWAVFLAQHSVSVQVSLDGSTPEIHDAVRGAGCQRKALRAIGLLQEAGLGEKIATCTTVMRPNLDDLQAIIGLTGKLGVPVVRFLPLRRKGMADTAWETVGTGFGAGDYERFFRQVADRRTDGKAVVSVSCGLSGFILKLPREAATDEIWCPVGRKIDIDVNGDAYPCVLLMEERYKIGNVHQESLAAMISSDAMRQVCRDLSLRRSTIERCASCLWSNLCQAGCMGQAMDHTGTIQAVDDFCRYRRQAYEEAFELILAQESPAGP